MSIYKREDLENIPQEGAFTTLLLSFLGNLQAFRNPKWTGKSSLLVSASKGIVPDRNSISINLSLQKKPQNPHNLKNNIAGRKYDHFIQPEFS